MQTVFPPRTKYSVSISEAVSLLGLLITTVSVISPKHTLQVSGISLSPYRIGVSALSRSRKLGVEGSPREYGWAQKTYWSQPGRPT